MSFLRYAILVSVMALGAACSNSVKLTGNEFLIKGKISDIEDGVAIWLFRIDDIGVGKRIATDTVRNGSFMFRGETESNPDLLSIMARGNGFPSMSLKVWAAPRANIKIYGKGKQNPLWKVKSSVPYQKEENLYIKNSIDIISEQVRMSLEMDELNAKTEAASSEEEALAYRQTKYSVLGEMIKLGIKSLSADMSIMEKTDISPVWLNKMQTITRFLWAAEYAELRPKAWELYGKMSEEDKNTPLGKQIIAALTPPKVVEVGEKMADADLLDANGNIKHLSDYSGKYLLLDFWSRGCGPCIMAFPEIKEIAETYRDKLTIISISFDSDATWKEAIGKYDMPWINFRDPKSWAGLSASYGVMAIPNYIMISPESIIVDKWAGYATGYLKQKVSENIN